MRGLIESPARGPQVSIGLYFFGPVYHNGHFSKKHVFSVLKEMFTSEKPADIHLVTEELKRVKQLEAVGGVVYLTTLAHYAGTSAYVEEYVEIVKKKAILREMIEAAKTIERSAAKEPDDVYSALDTAQNFFFQIGLH